MQSLSLRAVRPHETDPSLSHRGVFPVRAELPQQQPSVELRVIRQQQDRNTGGNYVLSTYLKYVCLMAREPLQVEVGRSNDSRSSSQAFLLLT